MGRGACLPMTNCDYYTRSPGRLGMQTRDAVGRMFLAASNLAGGAIASEKPRVCVCVWGGGSSRRSEDEEITAVLKQITSAASGCEETRAPTWRCIGCSVRGGKGGRFVGVGGSDVVSEGQIAGPSALYATRFLSGTWARGGLRADSDNEIVAGICHGRPGQRGGPQGWLSYPCIGEFISSPLST